MFGMVSVYNLYKEYLIVDTDLAKHLLLTERERERE